MKHLLPAANNTKNLPRWTLNTCPNCQGVVLVSSKNILNGRREVGLTASPLQYHTGYHSCVNIFEYKTWLSDKLA